MQVLRRDKTVAKVVEFGKTGRWTETLQQGNEALVQISRCLSSYIAGSGIGGERGVCSRPQQHLRQSSDCPPSMGTRRLGRCDNVYETGTVV